MGINQKYKNLALASLETKWSKAAIATLIVFLIVGGISEVMTFPMNDLTGAGFSGFWSLLCIPLGWGGTVFFLNLIRHEDISYSRLFDGYKDFVRIFVTMFLVGLCEFIGTLFFIVPGIIIGLMLCMTSFVLKDDKQIGCIEAMKQSIRLTKGHKMELFWLILSFIGWALLSIMTLCIGFLFLVPYYYTTLAHYYENLKAEQEKAVGTL